jgi:hypothetical protein
MNRTEIEQGHWVERYLAGRLSETETRRFEAYWIEHPALISDLEAGSRLKSGLAGLRERGELAGLLRPSWWSGRLRLLALAASVAVVAVGAALWVGGRDTAGALLAATPSALSPFEGSPLARGRVQTIMRLRSATSFDAVITLPDSPQAIELRVLPDVDAAAPSAESSDGARRGYAITLVREDDAPGVGPAPRAEPVLADAEGFASIYVDSRRLAPGRYQLQIQPVGAADGAHDSRFRIDVRRGDPQA